jgi:sugar lactone lactonase YvrE
VSAQGNVYVADTGNKRIVSFTGDGKELETWGADGSAPKQFIEPVGVTVNDNDEIIVCDTGNRRLQVFLSDGTFQKEWPIYGWEEFYTEPYIDTLGEDILVTDSYNHRFARYRDGKLTGVWGRTGKGPGDMNRPIGIAAMPPNIVYVSDTLNHRIQKFEIPAE